MQNLVVVGSHRSTQRPQHEIAPEQEEKIEEGDGQPGPLAGLDANEFFDQVPGSDLRHQPSMMLTSCPGCSRSLPRTTTRSPAATSPMISMSSPWPTPAVTVTWRAVLFSSTTNTLMPSGRSTSASRG